MRPRNKTFTVSCDKVTENAYTLWGKVDDRTTTNTMREYEESEVVLLNDSRLHEAMTFLG